MGAPSGSARWVRSLPRYAGTGWPRLGQRGRAAIRPGYVVVAVATRWRRSLQLRVVLTTLVLSAVVVALLGALLTHQVGSGLVEAKVRSALGEATSELTSAQSQLAITEGEPGITQALEGVIAGLASRGQPAGLYEVVLLSNSTATSGIFSSGADPSDVPRRLREKIPADGQPAYVFAPVHHAGTVSTGLIVGGPLRTPNNESYQLFLLFPLTAEEQTLGLVERTLALAGVALVALLAGVAALVTRQVVSPVRVAARTAERFSAGRLSERMAVKGEDDLARLATSFNTMAASLQGQIGQLEELSRVQRRFVADVSHELRTPLTTVRLAADVLHAARPDFPPHVARSAELLQVELDRFESLLVDLLEISRFDALAAVLEPEPVDLVALVRDVVAATAPLAARRGSALDISGLPLRPVIAEVDPRRVRRVVRNLLANAIEYGEGRPVVVQLAADELAVAVAVRDNGIGLQPGEAALAFTRFWRADPSRARHTGGTGLGLAISLEDARLHGGTLDAWGEPSTGAQFRLTLPRHAGGTFVVSPLPLGPTATTVLGPA